MTKPNKKIVTDSNQMSLLDLLQQEQCLRQEGVIGRLSVATKLQASIRAAIKSAPKSREVIADEMSELTGVSISVHQVNNWTANSHPHRMPAEIIPAFCQSTGSIEPIRIMAEAAGVYTLPGTDVLRAEVQKKREEKRKLDNDIRRCEQFLKEITK